MEKFKFKKGDKVRVIVFDDKNFGYGELLTVDENDDVPYCINEEGERWAMDQDELILVERKSNIFSRFYTWLMYDGVQEKFEDIQEEFVMVDERLDEIEDQMEALLEKLGVHVHYTVGDSFGEFKATVVDNNKSKAKKAAKTVTKTPRGKK